VASVFHRPSAIAVFATSVGALIWNAWFRESVHGDAVVGEAYLELYAAIAIAVAALFVMLFPGCRPQDRYWGYATFGIVIGFLLQR
jgi:hypothetical protein